MSTTLSNNYSVHPQKFLLWVGLASIVMMFAGLTSAFIVRYAQGNWYEYLIPDIFWYSTALILLSSVTIAIASHAFKRDKRSLYTSMLGLSLLFGAGFLYCQVQGFQELVRNGIYLEGNPSGGFFYIIAGLHGLHVAGGVLFILIFFLKSFSRDNAIKKLMRDVNPHRNLGIELLGTYWHFVDVLWLYLFFFLKMYE